MIRQILFVLVLLVGLSGCAEFPSAFNAQHPGEMPFAGGAVQVFFTNPEYNSTDPLVKEDIERTAVFGKKEMGFPSVTGGIGMMGVWHF